MEQLPPTEGNGEEGAHPMTGVETLPDSSEDEVEPTIVDQSKEPLLGSRGDESHKTKLLIHLAAPFEPRRSLWIAPAKKNPLMRFIIPPKLSKDKRKSTFKMAEVYLQAGVQFILQSVNAD